MVLTIGYYAYAYYYGLVWGATVLWYLRRYEHHSTRLYVPIESCTMESLNFAKSILRLSPSATQL